MTQQSGASGIALGTVAGGILGGTYPNPSYAGGASYPALTYLEALLGVNTNSGVSSSYVDIVTLAITAGSWLLAFSTVALAPGASVNLFTQVTDGTNVLFGARGVSGAANLYSFGSQRGIVAAAPVTLRLQAASDTGSAWNLRANAQASSTDHATILTALRFA